MTTFTPGSTVRVYSEDTRGMITATVTGHLGELVGVQAPGDEAICYLPAEMVHAATA